MGKHRLTTDEVLHHILAALQAPKPVSLTEEAIARVAGRSPQPRRGAVGSSARGGWSAETWEADTAQSVYIWAVDVDRQILPAPPPGFRYLIRSAIVSAVNTGGVSVEPVGIAPANEQNTAPEPEPAENVPSFMGHHIYGIQLVGGEGNVAHLIVPEAPVPWPLKRGVWTVSTTTVEVRVMLMYHIIPERPQQ